MKVLFLQGGLPHYYTLVLNKLNQFPDLDIALIIPLRSGLTVGSGVEQNRKDVNFPLFELPEYKTYYSKPFFEGFEKVLKDFTPDIILTGWPYMMHFVFYPSLLKEIHKKGIALIYKDIPFNIPPYGKASQFFRANQNLSENLGSFSWPWWEEFKFILLTEVRKRYLRLVDAHIYYTQEAVDLMKTYGIPKEKIFISANSPDSDILLGTFEKVKKELPILKPNSYRIIHVGRLVKWKRVDLLIEAVKNLKDKFPEIELLIAGYGPEEENLKSLVTKSGVVSHVQFLGGVYDPLILGHYLHESQIYVLAGMGGLSINDAMCFAKPIICSVADGTEKQLVIEGENGFFFRNGDLIDLVAKIDYLLSHPDKIRSFGNKSLEIIENEVNIHTVLESYIRAFEFAIFSSRKTKNIL